MEIGGKSLSASLQTYLKQCDPVLSKKTGSVEAKGAEGERDRVEISEEARRLGRIQEEFDQIPDIREERVEAIRARISAGTYSVDAVRTADRMLEESMLNGLLA